MNKLPLLNRFREISLMVVSIGKNSFSTLVLGALLMFATLPSHAQGDAKTRTQLDVKQIMVGDQARLFIEIQNNPATGKVQWPVVPDTFNNLEVVERGKIDTTKEGDLVRYRQRLNITGFDSGVFKIPAFAFSVTPNSGNPYIVLSDSFALTVQTVAVDTTKGFKGIKGIMYVKSTWKDYLLYFLGAVVILGILIFVVIYFLKNKKILAPKPLGPQESLQDKTLRLLAELDAKSLWQKKQVKEYYIQLTDIVRDYIEQRFRTPAMELTTDELLHQVQSHKDLITYYSILSDILHTADLAKFAKAEPLPQEHIDTMDKAKLFVDKSRPASTTFDLNLPEQQQTNTEPPTEKTI